MELRLNGECGESDFWREVRECVEAMADALPPQARGWSVTLRRKVPADNVELIGAGEPDDPTDYWVVFINDDIKDITIGVPTDDDEDLAGATTTARFLVELLDQVANATPECE
jgi:hypothetical protein